MNKKILLLFPVLLCCFRSWAQDQYFPMGSPAYSILERMEMKSGSLKNDLYLDIQPVSRKNAADYLRSLDTSAIHLSRADRYWLNYLANDNLPYSSADWKSSRHPLLKYFYQSKANFIQGQTNDSSFQIFINPVLGLSYGRETQSNQTIYRNTRGVEIRGTVDRKIGFYTLITDNQASFPNYIQNYVKKYGAIPGEGYWKPFKSNGYDYFDALAYVTYSPTRHVHLEFGNQPAFIGSGYRSLMLSNFSPNYLNLKANVRIWRLQYQMIFAEFTDFQHDTITPYPKKYGAFHYLSFDASKHINFGLFEGVIFHDNTNQKRGFELNYLNPIIFYRYAEQQMGSPDNVVVGGNLDIIPCKNVKLYGQALFDEFKISELRSGRGWWGNKFALQGGIKWINIFGLQNVDLQEEVNIIRPYTYSADTSGKDYVHYNQSLAHPLGANLRELVSILRVNIYGPLDLRLKVFYIQQGLDSARRSDVGADPLLSYKDRTSDYGNVLLQGVLSNTMLAEGTLSYQLRQNLFLDLDMVVRKQTGGTNLNTAYIGAGIRLNFAHPYYEF